MSDLLFSWESALGGFAGACVAYAAMQLIGWARRSNLLCRWRHRWIGDETTDRSCRRCGHYEILTDTGWIPYQEYLKHGAEAD